jgi:predicted oxidoreductase
MEEENGGREEEEEEEKVGGNSFNSFDGIFLSNGVEDCIVLCK